VVGNRGGEDWMTLSIESPSAGDAALAAAIEATVRDLMKVRGEVKLVAPGSLPNDGKVIEDARAYS
jgi:phenylacetate-CoA ligase